MRVTTHQTACDVRVIRTSRLEQLPIKVHPVQTIKEVSRAMKELHFDFLLRQLGFDVSMAPERAPPIEQ